MKEFINRVQQDGKVDTTYSKVRECLRRDILSNYFAPGTRLKIAELIKLYNVSQMPIREALQQLQGEGLIIIEPHKGAYVRELDEKFVSNIYDIRRIIEVFLTLESLKKVTDRDIKKLFQTQKNYEKASVKRDVESMLKCNSQFHTTLYQLADNDEALHIIEKHSQLINSLRLSYGFEGNRVEEVIVEHREILEAISLRDEKLLEKAATSHCLNAKANLLAAMKN
ncbi:GntR family transcriptional regulator [Sinomicrobium sp.]